MTARFATQTGTQAYSTRFPEQTQQGFYRSVGELTVSSLGLGTYLGGLDEATDEAYSQAIVAAVCGGINFLDAAINYRHQRSERSIGVALDYLFRGEFDREQIVVCTKAGFLTPGALNPATLRPEEIVGQMHAIAPDFLSDQIDRSRQNLGLETIDVFYLHNPETQLGFVDRPEFEKRIRQAFARCEQAVGEGRIRWYGTATWNGFRVKSDAAEWLPFERLVRLAREAGGEDHHFRFLQLPLNLAMTEAYGRANQPWLGQQISILEAAAKAGVHVVASASLLQAKLVKDLPEELRDKLGAFQTDAQRAIQFTRSTPGVDVALVGMSQTAHVSENLMLSTVPPLTSEAHHGLFQ
ncbi:MAG: aldo/keto reductase [Bryobacteraceae bacterium]